MSPISQKMVAPDNALDAYLDKIESLPPTPTVLVKLIDLFCQPTTDADDVVTLLRRDPVLSLEVLRRCNTSFFGTGSNITDVGEAVYRLGFYEVYQITATLLSLQTMAASNCAPNFPAEELRRHSSIAAIAAGVLASEVGLADGMAFTIALLHDIGKVVFALAEGNRYVALIAAAEQTGGSLSRLERAAFGFDHAEIGARLLLRWGLPEELVLPVLGHIDFEAAEPTARELTIITHGASALADHIQSSAQTPFADTPGARYLMDHFHLNPSQINGWEYQVRSRVDQLAALAAPAPGS